MISEYWENVLQHYLLVAGISSFLVIPISSPSIFVSGIQLGILFIAGLLAYVPVCYFIYHPTFTGDFLAKLESAITAYEGNGPAWLEKCKQDQLSNRALVLLFYVLEKISKLTFLSATDRCADLLHQILALAQRE